MPFEKYIHRMKAIRYILLLALWSNPVFSQDKAPVKAGTTETSASETPSGAKGDVKQPNETTTPIVSTTTSANLRFLTGFRGGTYNQIANDMKSLPGFQFNIKTSHGSIENILAIRDRKADIAIAQMDILAKFALRRPDIRDKVKIIVPLFQD